MAADLTVVVLVDPGHLCERRQVTQVGGEGFLDAGTDIADHRLGVRAANIQRHTVAAGFVVAINMLITVSQRGQRRQNHVGWQRERIAELGLQGDRLTVELAVCCPGEAGEISATHGAVVLTVEACREVQVPRIAGVACVTNHAVVIGGGGVAAQVVFAVNRGIAVVHRSAQTPVVAQRTVGPDDQAAKLSGVATDLIAAVLTGITAKRLAPDDPVAGVVVAGCHTAGA
ncbi:hypothetical protein D3C75_740220 [compost metagenome]